MPQFIKCDSEGAELLIFRGALKTLDRVNAPVLLFEVNKKAARSFGIETEQYFSELGKLKYPKYEFFEVLPDKIKPLENRKIEYTNVIAVPRERKKQINALKT